MQRITRFLEDARRELIDISRRNRLLHSPRSIDRTPRRGAADNNGGSAGGPSRTVRSHCLELQGVDLDAAFGSLREGKSFGFAAAASESEFSDDRSRSRAPLRFRTQLAPDALDLVANVSLRERLRQTNGIELPDTRMGMTGYPRPILRPLLMP